MAQNSAGICLGYAASATAFSTATKIPDITSIPDIGGEPEALDATTLDNLRYTSYIAGLQDLGGNFGFEANLTPELRTAVAAAITAGANDQYWFLYFPKPLNMYYSWKGKAQPLPVSGVGVNEVVKTTLYITVEELSEHDAPAGDTSHPLPNWVQDVDKDGILEGSDETGA